MTGHEYQELYEESPDKAYSMLFDNSEVQHHVLILRNVSAIFLRIYFSD